MRYFPVREHIMRSLLVLLGFLAPQVTVSQSLANDAMRDRDPSSTISFPNPAGDVDFLHEMHYSDLEIDCVECHHETNAGALQTPHTRYLETSSIDCMACHQEGVEASSPQSCSHCHGDNPVDIADETLSSKVVIHQVCWSCHDVGSGAAASRGCSSCHQSNEESE